MLLAGPTSFDDGVCAENSGAPIAVQRNSEGKGGPCKTQFKLPTTLQQGSTVTVYWVWDYDLHFGPERLPHTEWYTSCADIKIAGGGNGTGGNGAGRNMTVRDVEYKHSSLKAHRYNRRYATHL
jgi:hypothetical protein